MGKKILRALSLWVIPPIGMVLIWLLYLTNRKRFHIPENFPEEPVIIAFWHGNLIMQMFTYYKCRKKTNIHILVSDHFDGQIIAKIAALFKLGTIRGSTTRGGAKVLLQALKFLSLGHDIGITPDGPKGPRHEISEGVIVMAQKRKVKVVIYSWVPSSFWQFQSWDKFVIPKPFGVIDFYASDPIDLEGLELDKAKAVLRKKLMEHAIL